MAAVAPIQVNGLSTPSLPASPESSASSSKRKRDTNDDETAPKPNSLDGLQLTTNGQQPPKQDERKLVRNVFEVLRRFDANNLILSRPIPELSSSGEPQAKRQKADESSASQSIQDKASRGNYAKLDDLVADVKRAVNDVLEALREATPGEDAQNFDEQLNQVLDFRKKALDLYQREIAYPETPAQASQRFSGEQPEGRYALSVYGLAPHGKTLYTNLQLPVRTSAHPEGLFKSISTAKLPQGIIATRVTPHSPKKKAKRAPTLGELYPPAANLPPLQAPKSSKSTTKSNVLGFHQPDPVYKCPHKAGLTYFSQHVAVGQWIDYSNATPSSHSQIKTKQRERAQSLAGHKPSTVELEMSEMETLFRRAFTSFAPSKDDTSAVIPSNHASRIWWQRTGQRQLQRMISAEESDDAPEESATEIPHDDVDVDAVEEAIRNWDGLIDPSLEDGPSKESKQEKSIDDKLMEASDLIETLASHQRNRHLALPTSKDRRSTDPVGADMLYNGSLVQQPGAEETEVYMKLKNALLDIILDLPPYALSRLDGDKLGDLFISTKLEIRTDVRQGINEEDESVVKARQQQQQQQQQQHMQASAPRQQSHRTPSVPGGVPYVNQQYYATQNRQPAPNTGAPPFYQQSPVRAQPSPLHQRPPMTSAMPPQMAQHASHVPHQSHSPHPQHRPSSSQQYRQPNGYSSTYAPQNPKPPAPYGHNAMPYSGTPGQSQAQRMAAHPGYAHGSPAGTPTQSQQPQRRFPSGNQGFATGYPPQQAPQPQHHQPMYHQQHAGQRPGYPQQYSNGQPNIPPRAAHPPQPTPQQHPYSPMQPQHHPHPQQMAQQPRFPQYAASPGPQPGQGHRYPMSGNQAMTPNGAHQGTTPSLGPSGFHTHMSESQQNQIMEQSRRSAQQQMQGGGGVGMNAGLAGIGLKGNFDMQKQLAANRAQQQHNPVMMQQQQQQQQQHMSPSPRAQVASPVGLHGAGGPSPVPMNGMMGSQQRHTSSAASFPHATPSPVQMGSQPRPPA
ncbi:hypothetical protein PpBr36_08221 [Pyricularia pennisetigena]|uniref:hypothetical protein n=1 Tax=Pyricularia pennisetigena TaxID=1578925 RepID=UPI00114F2C6C|nr:hypothetical protein PpBr36_08221 [Pyricularia pennisetigena]TLS23885.1 hypothetical protein PpBr36_08221 [Pyricularia pennisetigena]